MFSVFSLFSDFMCVLLGVSAINNNFPPPLSAKEEHECFVLANSGDETARSKLIEHNLRLVAHIVRKYYSAYQTSDDLISIGCIGLIKAIDSFDINAGARFATYGAKCIQNEILMYFRSQKKLSQEVSINETIDIDHNGNPLTYIDIISCEDTIADDIDARLKTERALEYVSRNLSDRERKIIIKRYGLDGSTPKAQREVALEMGISRSYVSRIEKAALEKIKKGF